MFVGGSLRQSDLGLHHSGSLIRVCAICLVGSVVVVYNILLWGV